MKLNTVNTFWAERSGNTAIVVGAVVTATALVFIPGPEKMSVAFAGSVLLGSGLGTKEQVENVEKLNRRLSALESQFPDCFTAPSIGRHGL